jgi:hypothetical protein
MFPARSESRKQSDNYCAIDLIQRILTSNSTMAPGLPQYLSDHIKAYCVGSLVNSSLHDLLGCIDPVEGALF